MSGNLAPVIVDSGGANLASLQFALERLGAQSQITADPVTIRSGTHVILPGVGSAVSAMRQLHDLGLTEVITSLTQPVLGICLGMQLLFGISEEGPTTCLGVIPAQIYRLQSAPGHPIPHMGWNQLELRRKDPLLEGIAFNDYVYFVHSYAAAVTELTLASTQYGGRLSAVIRCRNFWGTQFHPERSGKTGARLLSNFLRI